MLGQLNFADFLKSPGGNEDAGGNDAMNFSLIPPTPQDRHASDSFNSHDFLFTPTVTEGPHSFGDFSTGSTQHHPEDFGSPPPGMSGIIAPSSPSLAAQAQAPAGPTTPALRRADSLRAPSTHSRSSSVSSNSISIRHEPYPTPTRRASAQSISSASTNGGGVHDTNAFSSSFTSDYSAIDHDRKVTGGAPPSTGSGLSTGCIDQKAMFSLCPGEMMQPMADSSMTTANETMHLQTPWTAQHLTADTSDEEESDDDDITNTTAHGSSSRRTQQQQQRGRSSSDADAAGESESGSQSSESEDSGSEYEESDQVAPPSRIRAPASKKSPIRATAASKKRPAARGKPILQRDDEPILVTAITASGKKSHARKRPIDHIPRPRNAFILFRKHVVDSKLIPPEVEIRHQNISVVVSKMWAEADVETKTKFQEQARLEKEEHMRNYPDYKYQPVYRRANVARRKIKADPVEEKKCEVVAALLIEGKQGEDLESGASKAVKAADRKRAAQAAKLQALRKSGSQNDLRRAKSSVSKGKKADFSRSNTPLSSARSSPALRAVDPPRTKPTLFPLAEQLLASTSIVVQGSRPGEPMQMQQVQGGHHPGHMQMQQQQPPSHATSHSRQRSSVSSMRDTASSSVVMTPQMGGGMQLQGGYDQQQHVVYHPQNISHQVQQHQQQHPHQHQQIYMHDGGMQMAMNMDGGSMAAPQHFVMDGQTYQIHDPQIMTIVKQEPQTHQPSPHSQQHHQQHQQQQQMQQVVVKQEQPPSHYVLQLLQNNNGMVTDMGMHGQGNMQVNSQGMYEVDMTGYSEALAHMGGYSHGGQM